MGSRSRIFAKRLGRPLQAAGPLARGEPLPQAPSGLVAAVFAAPADGVAVVAEADRVALAQVAEVTPFDRSAEDGAQAAASVEEQLRLQAADDALALTVQALQARDGVSVDQTLVEQVLAQFP